MTEDDLRALIKDLADEHGSLLVVAKNVLGCSHTYLCSFMRGHVPAGPSILGKLGQATQPKTKIVRHVTYERVKE